MSSAAAQFAFAAEFALFLVAVTGLACAVRPGLLSDAPWARSALASGFLGLATASFLRGALVVEQADDAVLVGLRLASGVAIAVGLVRWRDRRSLLVMVAGVLALATAGASVLRDHVVFGDGCRAVAALGFAAGLMSAARRSVAARIAVDAAALVLGVVLVVAVAVSVTVTDNVDHEAEQRYAARAAGEADAVADRARSALGPARIASGILAAERGEVLLRVHGGSARPADAGDLAQALTDVAGDDLLDLPDPVMFVTADRVAAASTPRDLASSTRLALAGDVVVSEAVAARSERQGVTVVGDDAFALAASPIAVRGRDGGRRFVGVVVVARPLDRTYLRVLGTAGERLTFAVATPGRVVARSGSEPSATRLREAASEVVDRGRRPRLQRDGRFVAAAPVAGGDGTTVLAFVVSAPADVAVATREALFRTLFLVALASALVAVVAAALVGERIGRGLRVLTVAAQRMQAGSLDAHVEVRSDDELGVLGGAFTSMAGSIKEKNDALQAAAVEEATIRARLEAVVAGMSEALVAVDRTGVVIELNRAAEELLGSDRAGVLGRPVGEVVRWWRDGDQLVPLSLEDDLDRGGPFAADLEVDGTSVPVMVTTGRLQGHDDQDVGAVLVLRDVRGEREVDDLKSSILANIGHELRTPLTPIKGYAAMLRDRQLATEQATAFAGEIVDGVEQLERVVHQLVTFATIAAGRLSVEPEPAPVADLAERTRLRWLERLDAAHPLVVRVPDLLGTIDVDADLLDQAIDELVDNAVKYSPDGGQVTVAFARSAPLATMNGKGRVPRDVTTDGDGDDEDATALTITVSDRGVGMAAERMGELVHAFSQGDASGTRRFGGLGLGLACADRIVRAHGGRLAYASTEHRGTSVSILLPMERAVSGALP